MTSTRRQLGRLRHFHLHPELGEAARGRPASLSLLQSCEIVEVGGTPSPKFGQRVARLSEGPSLGCIGAVFFSEKMQHCASSANFSKFANFDVAKIFFWEMSQKFFSQFFFVNLANLPVCQSGKLADWQFRNLAISQSRNLAIWQSGNQLADWQIGRLADCKIANLPDWQIGKLEDCKLGMLEAWKD